MKTLITPSILSADLGHLQQEVETIESSADWLQLDVMDGHFVPNLSFGAPVLRCVKTKLPIDIHLMVSNPEARIEEFLALKAANITFHAEAVLNTDERRALIASIHHGGTKAGIAIKPSTPLAAIADVVAEVDLVLVMSVEPGFSGQKFLPEVLTKVEALRAKFPALMIQMDGGINAENAALCRNAGANNLVTASYVFSAENRAEAISLLRGA